MTISKLFVCPRENLERILHGWQPLSTGLRHGINQVTGEPLSFSSRGPAQPIAEDALASLDDVPGELVPWTPLLVDILTKAFGRDPEASFRQPVLLGPGDHKAFEVPKSVIEGLATLAEPQPAFAERMARLMMDWLHADEHGTEMPLDLNEYVDLPLEELRAKTFRLEDLETDRAAWEKRFQSWEATLLAAVPFARSVTPGDDCFYVWWREEDPRASSRSAALANAKKKAQRSEKPVKKTASKQPVKKAASKQPAKKAASKQPVKKAASKQPVKAPKKAASKKPVKKAASKKPAKKAASKQPAKKAASKAKRTKTAAKKAPARKLAKASPAKRTAKKAAKKAPKKAATKRR